MSTADTARAAEPGQGTPSASRIVRIGRVALPVMVATAVVATAVMALPHGAWLPVPRQGAPLDVWQWPLERTTTWLAHAHLRVARLLTPDAVRGGLWLCGAVSAATSATLAIALRSSGLTAVPAALLALVASSAPLLLWQAGSPFGGAVLSLASTLCLWRTTRPSAGRPTAAAPPIVVAGAVAMGLLLAWGFGELGETIGRLRTDLSALGVLLVLASCAARFSSRGNATQPTSSGSRAFELRPWDFALRRAWLGLAGGLVATAPLPAHLRAAAVLPWAWWLVGDGLMQAMAWRARPTTRWLVVGLAAWTGLHVARVPWGQQRQHVALVRSWAEGVTGLASADRPIVARATADGVLVDALLTERTRRESSRPLVAIDAVHDVTAGGRHPVVVDARSRDALQWGGVALDELDRVGGRPLESVLNSLPGGTIVLAAISQQAAATLTPSQWQVLGRIGLRLADAGSARSHAVVGVTGARVESLEVAQAGSVRLDVQPGDPLGRTGTRAPVDAQLDADATHVRILLRDRPFIDEAGLALVFFSTRGDMLGWRSGADGAHLDGPPLGSGPLVRHVATTALPCVDLEAGRNTDLQSVLGTGTLGLTPARGPATLALVARDPSASLAPVLLTRDDEATTSRVTPGGGASRAQVVLTTATLTGLSLRHDGALSGLADAPLRVCAAAPLPRAFALNEGPVDLALLPRHEPLFGSGWHALEVVAGGGYFRWMDGPRATLAIPLRTAADVRIVLDAQGVRAPIAGDLVRLAVNGRVLGDRPLHPTRGLYEWDVPAATLHAGVNIVRLETTATIRPADTSPGADPRRLGLLVYGWRLVPGAGQ